MLKAFLPAMIERNDGHIVSVASTAGYFGVPRLGAYCSSKAAALNLHYSLVAELAAADEGALGAAARARRAGRIGSTVVCPYFLRGTHMQLVGQHNECAASCQSYSSSNRILGRGSVSIQYNSSQYKSLVLIRLYE